MMKHKSGAGSGARIHRSAETVAGAPAVIEASRHAVGQAGFYRGLTASLKVKQASGIDRFQCP